MEEKAASAAFQYGAVGVIALVFAVAIVILWRHLLKREDKLDGERELMTKERASWEAREIQIRAEGAAQLAKLREESAAQNTALMEKFAQDMRALFVEQQLREDAARREFAEIMEGVEQQAKESSDALIAILQKFYDRFVGPRRGY
jgi:hypothetical protein